MAGMVVRLFTGKENETGMELKRYTQLLWHGAWIVLLCMLMGGGAAFWFSQQTVPRYEATSSLLIFQAPANSALPDYNSVLASERLARTYAELLQKRPVLDEVIATLDLATDAKTLQESLQVSVVRDTQLIALTVEDTDPQRAAAIANEIITVFIEQNQMLQASRYTESRESLEEEVSSVKELIARTEQTFEQQQQEMADVQTEIETLRASIERDETQLASADDAETLRLQTSLSRQRAQLRTYEQTLGDLRADLEETQVLQAQYRNNYTMLLESLEEVRLSQTQTSDTLSVAERATPPEQPVRPRPLLDTLLGMVAGMLLGVALIFLREYLDDRVKSHKHVEEVMTVPVLAGIARIKEARGSTPLLSATHEHSPAAEAYRLLYANIEFAMAKQPLRTLLVTSSSPQEGKSTTVANLGITIARTGQRVILVDTDLRRPALHTFFQMHNGPGVTTALLRENRDLDDLLRPTEIENLSLFSSGALPPNPAELLGSQRMAELIEQLKARADVVIFDSPPLLSMVDATLLGRRCDATLLVVMDGTTLVGMLNRSREQIQQSGAHLIGSVLNRVTPSNSGYYGYYEYHSYYGKEKKRWRNGKQEALQSQQ